MNLLVVTHFYPEHGGGIELVAWELINRLIASGMRVTWAASAPASPNRLPGLTFLPMRSANPVERRLGIPYPLWSAGSLVSLLRAIRRCDAVHLHDSLYMGNIVAYFYASQLGKPIIITQHVGDITYRRLVARALLRCANATFARWVLRGSSRAVFCSDKVLKYFSRDVQFRRDPVHIGNGVDAKVFAPAARHDRLDLRRRFGWPHDKPVLLFVGRFVEKKGLHIIRELAVKFPAWTWVLAGAGPIRPCDWKLPNVSSFGWVNHEDLAPFYQAADLLVLPSVGEGFPLVVQESMACGTPALISDDTASGWPGIDECAFVCEPRADRMAALLSKVLANASLLDERRAATATYARTQWNWDVCARRYLDLFEQLSSTHAKRKGSTSGSGDDDAQQASQSIVVAPLAPFARGAPQCSP